MLVFIPRSTVALTVHLTFVVGSFLFSTVIPVTKTPSCPCWLFCAGSTELIATMPLTVKLASVIRHQWSPSGDSQVSIGQKMTELQNRNQTIETVLSKFWNQTTFCEFA